MNLLKRAVKVVTESNESSKIEAMAKKYYDHVQVFYDGPTDDYDRSYPYRCHIRTDNITNDLIYDLEQAGFECRKGQTCNEWETSMRIKKNSTIHMHPPHMPVSMTPPTELGKMAPMWNEFLENTGFLGHLLGTLDNGIRVPKQAFGECQTSIVLETFKRAFGADYKKHQCNTCIEFEIGFKYSIESHLIQDFENGLTAFVAHFKQEHATEFNRLQNTPDNYISDGEVGYDYRDTHPVGYLDS